MRMGRVVGNIVSTRKNSNIVGSSILEVRLVENGKETDKYMIAIDSMGGRHRGIRADHHRQQRASGAAEYLGASGCSHCRYCGLTHKKKLHRPAADGGERHGFAK